ncbi:hypothetical protein PVAP13_2KG050732 [Panicum virgatum]|uniref:Uncharacterized protein n=1 Tax=Panicum virgatum TaxID=38727 RepID=A0A8T0VXL4_PANVG|nr:hypothetical protein PVAP13_2KG050732 [Panicum virgatum]
MATARRRPPYCPAAPARSGPTHVKPQKPTTQNYLHATCNPLNEHRHPLRQEQPAKLSAAAGETDSRNPNPTDREDWKLPPLFAEMKQATSHIGFLVPLQSNQIEGRNQDQYVGNKRTQEAKLHTISAATTAMTAKDRTHTGKHRHNQDAQDEQKAHTQLTDEEAAGTEEEHDAREHFSG